jgi:hypothetical protein
MEEDYRFSRRCHLSQVKEMENDRCPFRLLQGACWEYKGALLAAAGFLIAFRRLG